MKRKTVTLLVLFLGEGRSGKCIQPVKDRAGISGHFTPFTLCFHAGIFKLCIQCKDSCNNSHVYDQDSRFNTWGANCIVRTAVIVMVQIVRI